MIISRGGISSPAANAVPTAVRQIKLSALSRDLGCIATGHLNRELRGPAEAALQVNVQGEAQGVKTRTEISARCRDPHGFPVFRHEQTILARIPRRDVRLRGIMAGCKVALCSLLRQPEFSLTVIAIFALAIAASTSVFGIFNGLFLSSLPYPAAQNLVYLTEVEPRLDTKQTSIAYVDFRAWQEGNASFESMSVFREDGGYLTGVGDPLPRHVCRRCLRPGQNVGNQAGAGAGFFA